ncbi:MAG: DUF4906 domain-containing protein [Bacteroides sp.]|nr:DUF4906 domain-containing protein [Bacteroides sp.]
MKRRLFPQIALWLLASGFCSACQDEIIATPPSVTDGKTVSVEVTFDTEDVQDACDLLPQQGAAATRTACPKGGAIKVELLPAAATRSIEQDKPTALTNVYIVQKKADGTTVMVLNNQPVSLGTKQTLTGLKEDGDSQLYILAANGATLNVAPSASNLADWAVTSASVNSVTDISKMPYYLHLKHVKITSSGIIQSLQGHDARLRLRRLAARINITWEFKGDIATGYTLREVTLQDTPLKYHAFPLDGKDTYPDLIDQYYTAKLYDAGSGSSSTNTATTASCWIARNVRGTANISNETMRSKDYAPQGSSYLLFVATRKDNPKQRLTYRIYLGGNSINDFNVQDNTNYTYGLTFTTDDNIANTDDRVQLLDGSAASVGNTTFVPTANCFMVKPGGSFHFDPFLFHRVEGGVEKDVENTVLKGWAANANRGGICSVKVLWQTRENGDTGDPVLGIVNSSTDHTNIVELTGVDNKSLTSVVTTGYTGSGQCHIHCRVAPGTIGGNGVIAAYDKNDTVLWSWHLWVTDYNPDPHGNASVLGDENKRKQKYAYREDKDWLPMMDRNIGAQKGFVDFPKDELERSRANGLGYTHGRKDPSPGSFSNKKLNQVTVTAGVVDGLLNMYGPDGYSVVSRDMNASGAQSESWTFTNILGWGYCKTTYWSGNEKTFYDPSPQGWRVPSYQTFLNFFSNKNYAGVNTTTPGTTAHSPLNGTYAGKDNTVANGGALIQYGTTDQEVTYVRLTGYRRGYNSFEGINSFVALWAREHNNSTTQAWAFAIDNAGIVSKNSYCTDLMSKWARSDAHQVRCIQEIE